VADESVAEIGFTTDNGVDIDDVLGCRCGSSVGVKAIAEVARPVVAAGLGSIGTGTVTHAFKKTVTRLTPMMCETFIIIKIPSQFVTVG
jgi:hypothetical protein